MEHCFLPPLKNLGDRIRIATQVGPRRRLIREMAHGVVCVSAVIVLGFGSHRQPLQKPRGNALRNLGGFILRHDPNFSRKAASLRKNRRRHRPILIILFILSKNSARRGMTHDSIERNRHQHSEDGGH